MISEKTVELNLTAELLNWLSGVTGQTLYVIAPSQRAEGKLGFDAHFRGVGQGLFIQFKRAKASLSRLTWELNRTRMRDQHKRLQALEALGLPVLYALPRFFSEQHVSANRRQLLLMTSWLRPSVIQLPGGPIGHHEIHLDLGTRRWTVTSENERELLAVNDALAQVVAVFSGRAEEGALDHMCRVANNLVFGGEHSEGQWQDFDREPGDESLTEGFCLLASSAEGSVDLETVE